MKQNTIDAFIELLKNQEALEDILADNRATQSEIEIVLSKLRESRRNLIVELQCEEPNPY